ncbi:hypothetical protein EBS02_05690 [bacterium]|nr:hypothetical protein [bacterium]
MLYHAILQLNQKAKQTKRAQLLLNTRVKKYSGKQTKKAKAQIISQTAFNNQNTVDRRNDFKKLVPPR